MNTLTWIEQVLKPKICNSEEFLYDEMESQSGFCLPIIYQSFDPHRPDHWLDRGSLFDYLYATQGQGRRLLDFGPGDGWPSLIVAPFAAAVVGVDGSRRRVEVCQQNATRLGIKNAEFHYVQPGNPLPFPDESFDGVMAASSLEQTPDPKATLGELFRVLRPGGRLRMSFEGLEIYRNGYEQAADLEPVDSSSCRLTLYDRHIAEENAVMYRLWLAVPVDQATRILPMDGEQVHWAAVEVSLLEKIRPQITHAQCCRLTHPSSTTFIHWMKEIGFREAQATHSGGGFAWQYFEHLPEKERPKDMESIDRLLQPLVQIVIHMAAPPHLPGGRDPMISAVK